MDKWDKMKDFLEDAISEGLQRGFDKLYDNEYEHGMYTAYKLVRDKMGWIEDNVRNEL
jgi:hypothetical protein